MGNRSTNAELDGLRDRIVRIAEATHPLSVRNLFYSSRLTMGVVSQSRRQRPPTGR